MLRASGGLLLGSSHLGACVTTAAPAPRRLRRPHPRVALTLPAEAPAAAGRWIEEHLPAALDLLAGWRLRLAHRVELRLHLEQAAFAAATGRPEPWLRAWAGFATVHLTPPSSWSDASPLAQVERLAHELTHAAVFQALGEEGAAARVRAPLWFREGSSSVVAEQERRRMPLALAVARAGGEDPLVDGARWMARDHHVAYAAAHHAVRALERRAGRGFLVRLLAAAREDGEEGAVQRALPAVCGLEERELWPWVARGGG